MSLKPRTIALGILEALGIVVGIILFLWVLIKIKYLLLCVLIAGVVALICRPIVLFLKDKLKLGNSIATILTLLSVIFFILVLFYIFIPVIVEQSKNISEIDFELLKSDLNELSMQASDYLGVYEVDFLKAIKQTEYVQNFSIDVIPSFFEVFFKNFGDLIAGIFSILFISFFLLKDEKLTENIVASLANKGQEKRIVLALYKIRILLSRYFVGLFFQLIILTTLYTILLLFFDLDNIVAIAIICAIFNIVPYLGPLFGGLLLVLVIISNNLAGDFSSDIVPLLFKLLVGYSIAQLIDNLLVQPFVFGKSVKSHPLEIFLVIIIGGLLFGIIGMIMAVPTYTAIKVTAKEFLSEYKVVKRLTKNF